MANKINHDLFSAHQHALEHKECPDCACAGREGELEIRHGKRGPFLGCNQYPTCTYIQPLHNNDGHVIKALGVACPQCEARVAEGFDDSAELGELLLRQGRYCMFIGCSLYPECDHIQSISDNAEPEQSSQGILCPECHQGQLTERQSRFGKTFYACDAYPKCKFSLNQLPVAGQCQACGFGLLIHKKTAKGEQLICAQRKCQHVQQS